MAYVLINDKETTGLNVREDYIIELGAVIYDTDTKQTFKPFCEIIKWPSRPVITPKIEKLTGISQKMVEKWGIPPEEAFARFYQLADLCDYVAAYNGYMFDDPIEETAVLRCHDPSNTLKRKFYGYKRLDVLTDLPYPEDLPTMKLKYNAYEHGYIMTNAHRAMPDVYAAAHLLGCYSWDEILKVHATPLQLQKVKCEWWEKEKHEELKSSKFYFDKPSKEWTRRERKYISDRRTSQLSFGINETVIITPQFHLSNQENLKVPAQSELPLLQESTCTDSGGLGSALP